MAYVGTPTRLARSRDMGPLCGLVPAQDQSGAHDPQLRITKTGDALVRACLLECAWSIMGKGGQDCALRRWALALAGSGRNQIRRKKAAVALARRLAILLHRLWVSGEEYDPWRGWKGRREEGAAA
jgi:transposase